jgi:hypothetical protein
MKKILLFIFSTFFIFPNNMYANDTNLNSQELRLFILETIVENGKAGWGEDEFRLENTGKNNLKNTKLFCYKKNFLTKSINMIGYHFVSSRHVNMLIGNNSGSTLENIKGDLGYYEVERSNIKVVVSKMRNNISRKSLSSTGGAGTFMLTNKCKKIDNKISITNKMYEILKKDREEYDNKSKL